MDNAVFGELALIFVLILANGFFSGAEIAILTASRGLLKDFAAAGDRGARAALQLVENPNRLLPTVQVGMTLIGTFTAAYSGITIVNVLSEVLRHVPSSGIARFHREVALVLVVLVITILSVVLGELVPKRLALRNATRWARHVALPLRFLSWVVHPMAWGLGGLTEVILRLLGAARRTEPSVSREEIEHLIEVGRAEGVFKPVEQQLAVGALNLGDRTVRQIMRPRLDIDAADVNTPVEEVLGVVVMAGFSRLPVYEGDMDHILGIVHLKDVLRQHYLGWPLDLRKLARPALFVPDTMRLDRLLVLFQERHNAAAIVVDEFGQTKGMVTLEDIVHEFVGEIQSEQQTGETDPDIVQRDDTSWLVSGTVAIDDLLTHLNRQHLCNSAPKNVTTVAGLLLTELGHIPKVGVKTTWHDLQLEVVDLDGQRVDKVLVSVVTEADRDKSAS